jgi:hypothetical protein
LFDCFLLFWDSGLDLVEETLGKAEAAAAEVLADPKPS